MGSSFWKPKSAPWYCEQCDEGGMTEKEAQWHASLTGHFSRSDQRP